jgi:AcrR family transcriptional regulator
LGHEWIEVVTQARPSPAARLALSKERVLRTAVELADAGGAEAVSMRKLGQELGVDAMSLYHHVQNKDDILDGIVDVVVGEIEIPAADGDWKGTLRGLIMSARTVMLRHAWAPRVIESRNGPGPATFRYMDTVLSILRGGGFSIDQAHHAMHVLGSRILGFNQDLFDDSAASRVDPEVAAFQARQLAGLYPAIGELALAVSHEGGLGGCDDDVEFAFGLDLILDALDRTRSAG